MSNGDECLSFDDLMKIVLMWNPRHFVEKRSDLTPNDYQPESE